MNDVRSLAVATAHVEATRAAIWVRKQGGSAIDCVIAAHAVIGVTMPEAAGLGGDLMALVMRVRDEPIAIRGAGGSAQIPHHPGTMGSSVTVPGMASAWQLMHTRWGHVDMSVTLNPAIQLARDGITVTPSLAAAVDHQRERLERGGAAEWSLLKLGAGDTWKQPEMANLLEALAHDGLDSFYSGEIARAIVRAAHAHGSTLTEGDFASHVTTTSPAVSIPWRGERLFVQPPPSQGLLLAMAAQWVDKNADSLVADSTRLDHVLVEVTEASFEHRDNVIRDGESLLSQPLEVDRDEAQHRGGPRAYLHTAGTAVATPEQVISSLISVSSDFGSAVFVPELGFVLNNRADSFTHGANEYRPGAFPVHTLAPAMVVGEDGSALALATPGADGQVQTLLQILCRQRFLHESLDEAIAAPRWREENSVVLVEETHEALVDLARRGHTTRTLPFGDAIFGAVVAAGVLDGQLVVGADHRRAVNGVIA